MLLLPCVGALSISPVPQMSPVRGRRACSVVADSDTRCRSGRPGQPAPAATFPLVRSAPNASLSRNLHLFSIPPIPARREGALYVNREPAAQQPLLCFAPSTAIWPLVGICAVQGAQTSCCSPPAVADHPAPCSRSCRPTPGHVRACSSASPLLHGPSPSSSFPLYHIPTLKSFQKTSNSNFY